MKIDLDALVLLCDYVETNDRGGQVEVLYSVKDGTAIQHDGHFVQFVAAIAVADDGPYVALEYVDREDAVWLRPDSLQGFRIYKEVV